MTLNLAMSQLVLPKTYFSTGTFFLSQKTSALTYATIKDITRLNYSLNTVFEQWILSPDPVRVKIYHSIWFPTLIMVLQCHPGLHLPMPSLML
jgi:hypothetical protein